jgi:hypothetical protein
METLKYVRIACNDEDWLKDKIDRFNQINSTNFLFVEMIYDEVNFAKVSFKEDLVHFFNLSRFISHYQMIEYIEGRII